MTNNKAVEDLRQDPWERVVRMSCQLARVLEDMTEHMEM